MIELEYWPKVVRVREIEPPFGWGRIPALYAMEDEKGEVHAHMSLVPGPDYTEIHMRNLASGQRGCGRYYDVHDASEALMGASFWAGIVVDLPRLVGQLEGGRYGLQRDLVRRAE